MGVLESGSNRCVLSADHVVGRSPNSSLRIEDQRVSWRHASLRWTGRTWEVQDLGSRNGTFVDGQPIAAGTRVPLRLGAQLQFGGSTEPWHLTDDDPPLACVVDLQSGERYFEQEGVIAVPNTDEPELLMSGQSEGEWVAELGGRVWEPAPLEVLSLGSRQFRFEPGAVIHATVAGRLDLPTPATLALEFVVSTNEEYVEITALHGERRIPLRPRAHSYLLLTLARLRLDDQQNAELGASSHGWVYQDTLLKMLSATATQVAVDIYRARKQFSEAGILDSVHIIERRATTHELRIGVPRLTISRA